MMRRILLLMLAVLSVMPAVGFAAFTGGDDGFHTDATQSTTQGTATLDCTYQGRDFQEAQASTAVGSFDAPPNTGTARTPIRVRTTGQYSGVGFVSGLCNVRIHQTESCSSPLLADVVHPIPITAVAEANISTTDVPTANFTNFQGELCIELVTNVSTATNTGTSNSSGKIGVAPYITTPTLISKQVNLFQNQTVTHNLTNPTNISSVTVGIVKSSDNSSARSATVDVTPSTAYSEQLIDFSPRPTLNVNYSYNYTAWGDNGNTYSRFSTGSVGSRSGFTPQTGPFNLTDVITCSNLRNLDGISLYNKREETNESGVILDLNSKGYNVTTNVSVNTSYLVNGGSTEQFANRSWKLNATGGWNLTTQINRTASASDDLTGLQYAMKFMVYNTRNGTENMTCVYNNTFLVSRVYQVSTQSGSINNRFGNSTPVVNRNFVQNVTGFLFTARGTLLPALTGVFVIEAVDNRTVTTEQTSSSLSTNSSGGISTTITHAATDLVDLFTNNRSKYLKISDDFGNYASFNGGTRNGTDEVYNLSQRLQISTSPNSITNSTTVKTAIVNRGLNQNVSLYLFLANGTRWSGSATFTPLIVDFSSSTIEVKPVPRPPNTTAFLNFSFTHGNGNLTDGLSLDTRQKSLRLLGSNGNAVSVDQVTNGTGGLYALSERLQVSSDIASINNESLVNVTPAIYNRGEDVNWSAFISLANGTLHRSQSSLNVHAKDNSSVVQSSTTSETTNANGFVDYPFRLANDSSAVATLIGMPYHVSLVDSFNNSLSYNTTFNGTRPGTFNVSNIYQFSTDSILFSHVMRGDIQRVNATFLTARGSIVRDGTLVNVSWFNPSGAQIYSTNKSTTDGITANFDQSMANNDAVGTWQLNYSIGPGGTGNFNNSMAPTLGGTFTLNNTIFPSNIVINKTGEFTSFKAFNRGEDLNISGILKHSDLGALRAKTPSGNSTRTVVVEIYNGAYGTGSLQNTTVRVDTLTGVFYANITLNATAQDTYTSSTANNSAEVFDYDIRFYDNTTDMASNALGNDGNITNQFDVDANYYFANDSIMFPIVMRGDTQRVNATFVTVRNLSVPANTNVTLTWYNATNQTRYQGRNLTTNGITANFDQQLANDDSVGRWRINYTILVTDPGNRNNSLAETGGSTFILNNTIATQNIGINMSGQLNTFRKIFNVGQRLNISGILLHPDGGAFRVKSPSGTSARTARVQIFNNTYGVDSLENTSAVVSSTTGFFVANITTNNTLNDTYQSTTANQSENLDYDIRFYDGTTSVSSNTQGNDGNLTNQFDIDKNVYVFNHYENDDNTDSQDIDLNSGDSDNKNVNTNFQRIYLKNGRNETTNEFSSISVSRVQFNPFTNATASTQSLSLTNTLSGGLYTGSDSGSPFTSFTTRGLNWTVLSSDGNGSTQVSQQDGGLQNITYGRLHYIAVNSTVNDTHVLRSQSVNTTLYFYDSYNDTEDDGNMNRTSGQIATALNATAWDLYDGLSNSNPPTSTQYEFVKNSESFVSGQHFNFSYVSNSRIDWRDLRVNAELGELGGLEYHDIVGGAYNKQTRNATSNNAGLYLVDDLLIAAITFAGNDTFYYDGNRTDPMFTPPINVTVIVNFTYAHLNFTNVQAANENYGWSNLTLFEWDGDTGNNTANRGSSAMYNVSDFNITSTNAQGFSNLSVKLFQTAEVGNNWSVRGTTYNATRIGYFDVNLVLTQVNYSARNQSNSSLTFLSQPASGVYFNRGEEGKVGFTIGNNPEGDQPGAGTKYIDSTEGNAILNSSGSFNATAQTLEFTWFWSNTSTAAKTMVGTEHATRLNMSFNNVNASVAPSVQPNVSSLLLADAHVQKSAVLSPDPMNRSIPNSDDGNEDADYILTADLEEIWVRAQNIRGEDVNLVNTSYYQCPATKSDCRGYATDNAQTSFSVTSPHSENSNRDGWSRVREISPNSPAGAWTALADINATWGNNSGSDQDALNFIAPFRANYYLVPAGENYIKNNDIIRPGVQAIFGVRIEKDNQPYHIDNNTVVTLRLGRFNATTGQVEYLLGSDNTSVNMTNASVYAVGGDTSIFFYNYTIPSNVTPGNYFAIYKATSDSAPVFGTTNFLIDVLDRQMLSREIQVYMNKSSGDLNLLDVKQGENVTFYARFLKNGTAVAPQGTPTINVTYMNGTTIQTLLSKTAMNTTGDSSLFMYTVPIPANESLNVHVATVHGRVDDFYMTQSYSFTVTDPSSGGSAPITLNCAQHAAPNYTVTCVSTVSSPKNGTVLTGQTVYFTVLNTSLQTIKSGNATEGNFGSYYFNFTPNSTGNYLAYVNWTYLGINYSASDAIYAEIFRLTVEQNETLYNISAKAEQLNSTLLSNANFGGNNLTDLKVRLQDLRTYLLLLREESKENVFLVTDAISSLDNVIEKYNKGEMTPSEAQAKASEILMKTKPAEDEVLAKRLKKEHGNRNALTGNLLGLTSSGSLETYIYWAKAIGIIAIIIFAIYWLEIDKKFARAIIRRIV